MTRRRGFTLFEMLVVLTIAGLIAGLVAAGARRSGGATRSAALAELGLMLESTRVRAMRTAAPVALTAATDDDGTLAASPDQATARRWPAARLHALDEHRRRIPQLRVVFEPSGRTRSIPLRFAADEDPTGTIFVIEFDPVSGAPLPHRREGQPAQEVLAP